MCVCVGCVLSVTYHVYKPSVFECTRLSYVYTLHECLCVYKYVRMYDMSTFMFAFIEYVWVLLRILCAAMCFLIHLCTHIYNFWADPSEIILYPIEAFIPAQISLVQNDAWTRNRLDFRIPSLGRRRSQDLPFG